MWLITHDLGYNVTIAGVVVFDNSHQELSTEQFTALTANAFYLYQVRRGMIKESSVQPATETNYYVRYLDGRIYLNGIPVNNETVTAITVAEALQQSGGIGDYTLLINKPQINDVTLIGNKTGQELGLADSTSLGNLSNLKTDDKTSLVSAINEIAESGAVISSITVEDIDNLF